MARAKRRQFNVRLKQQTVFAIETLAEKWECSQAEVVERLVRVAEVSPEVRVVGQLPGVAELKVEYDET